MSADHTPAYDTLTAEIDDVVATCNGDLRGALKALLLINEQLERELQVQLALGARIMPRFCTADTMH